MTVTQALRMLWSAIPVSAFMEGAVPLLSMTDTLERAKKAVLDSSSRCAVVLDTQHHPANIVTRSDLIRFARKKVILVDHNETLQAVDGVEEADILEIIDHHRVGDISTFRPIYFYNEPVGSTCTIVAELCAENGVFLPKSMAGILLSGILSDTMNLNLSTTTPKDVRAVRRLAAAIGIDAEAFGLELLQNGSVMFKGLPAADVIMRDFKEFDLFDTRIGVSQAVVFSFDQIREREAEFKQAMQDTRMRMGLKWSHSWPLTAEQEIVLDRFRSPRRIRRSIRCPCPGWTCDSWWGALSEEGLHSASCRGSIEVCMMRMGVTMSPEVRYVPEGSSGACQGCGDMSTRVG